MANAGTFGAALGEGSKSFLEAFKTGRSIRGAEEDRAFRREKFEEQKSQHAAEQERLGKQLEMNRVNAAVTNFSTIMKTLSDMHGAGATPAAMQDYIKNLTKRSGLEIDPKIAKEFTGGEFAELSRLSQVLTDPQKTEFAKMLGNKENFTAAGAKVLRTWIVDRDKENRALVETKRKESVKEREDLEKRAEKVGVQAFLTDKEGNLRKDPKGQPIPKPLAQLSSEVSAAEAEERQVDIKQTRERTTAIGARAEAEKTGIALEKEKFEFKKDEKFVAAHAKLSNILIRFRITRSEDLRKLKKNDRIELAKEITTQLGVFYSIFPDRAKAAGLPRVFSAGQPRGLKRILEFLHGEAPIKAETPTPTPETAREVTKLFSEKVRKGLGSAPPNVERAPPVTLKGERAQRPGESGADYLKRLKGIQRGEK